MTNVPPARRKGDSSKNLKVCAIVLTDAKKMTDRETEIGVPVVVNMFLDYCCSCCGGFFSLVSDLSCVIAVCV